MYMLAATGLGLGVVAAFVFALSLFRPPVQLLPGWARDPLVAASDYAAGVVGCGCLSVSFVLQALPLEGLDSKPSRSAVAIGGGMGLIGGGLLAYIVYELLRWRLFPHIVSGTGTQADQGRLVFDPGREGSGLVFHLWRHERPTARE